MLPVSSSVASRFGENTFSRLVMRQKLPKDVFTSLQRTLDAGEKLHPDLANAVAHAMKEWALERGATHYCHWFQPLTGATAEKHDAFLSIDRDGLVLERFSGNQLLQSEPDASSFPSGGMRSTFEARGYTAWDPSSPAFLMEGPQGITLCIPSIYFGYRGEVLDEKTPLLRSMDALSRAAVDMVHFLGRSHVQRVVTLVGSEQEYFLVDAKYFDQRQDLLLTGRTLLGALPPKGQQLEDHYFGAIPDRVLDFMQEIEKELYKLGIPAKTRHNEVAPHQYEIAPIHEEANLAADHNLLLMETMRKVATRKGLALLLHEKPFAGINGSGKHNNWSMADSDGVNLLDPGKTPESNLQFLVFLVATLKAVHRRAAMLRASIASAGNDHRLGANEAPPAIMSVFLGQQLDRILNQIEIGEVTEVSEDQFLHLGVSRLPAVLQDNTDRNRTSPFAFTGNKFEFRAVPASIPISMPNTVLNAAVAEALHTMLGQLRTRVQSNSDKNAVILELLREEIRLTRSVRFEGDGYSEDWLSTAERRGLPHAKNTPEALKAWGDPSNRQMFIELGILREIELDSRYHIRIEQYIKQIEMEAKTMLKMVQTEVLPTCFRYQCEVSNSVSSLSQLLSRNNAPHAAVENQEKWMVRLAENLSRLIARADELEQAIHRIHSHDSLESQAQFCVLEVMDRMKETRAEADSLETLIEGRMWPMPTYLDLLFRL